MHNFFWISEFFDFASETIIISIILGLFFTLLSQSASVITILIITLVSSQAIPMDSAIFIIIGSNIGSGLSLLLFHPNLEGQQKRIILFQLSTKILGSFFILIIVLIAPHIFFDFTLYKNINSLTIQLSLLYLYLQITGALIATILNGKINALLSHLVPDQEIDLISKPKFIYQEILNDEEIAINLINQEQQRLLSFLPKYMDYVRQDKKSDLLLLERHKAYSLLYLAIKDFTDQVISNNRQEGISELLILQSKNESINSLMYSLENFTTIANENNFEKQGLSISMAESLHMLLTLLSECETSHEDIEMLINLTAEQGSLMDDMRTKVSKLNGTSGHEQKTLFLLTRLFERLVWQIRKHNSIKRSNKIA
jgi:phosphate:Na+ symporter